MTDRVPTPRPLLRPPEGPATDVRAVARLGTRRACRRARALALAFPMLLARERGIPLEEVAVRGVLEPVSHQIRGTISTDVPTPFGRVPVTGHVVAGYTCEGSFAGRVGYGLVVRLAARLKRIELVTRVDGHVVRSASATCAPTTEEIAGRFWIADSVVTGYVRAGTDSLGVAGIVRTVGASAYHAELCPSDGTGAFTASINLSER